MSSNRLWPELLKLEAKARKRSVFRTWSGEVIVCDPDLARASLETDEEIVFRRPPVWRQGRQLVPDPIRKKVNRWLVQRLYQQDPVQSAKLTVERVLAKEGDLHAICVQAIVSSLKAPMDCASNPLLESAVRSFFETVFVPSIRGTLDGRRNEELFERASARTGECLTATEDRTFPDDLGFEDEEGASTLLGELYLRRIAAFVSSTSSSLSWLFTAIHSPNPPALAEPISLSTVRETNPQWVALECLRLWPPPWRLRRTVKTDHQLGPVSALAGDELHVLIYIANRHPGFWPEPDRFIPERWRDLSPRALLSFGAGPGSCVASRFMLEWLTTAVELVSAERRSLTQLGRHPHLTTTFTPPLTRISRN